METLREKIAWAMRLDVSRDGAIGVEKILLRVWVGFLAIVVVAVAGSYYIYHPNIGAPDYVYLPQIQYYQQIETWERFGYQ